MSAKSDIRGVIEAVRRHVERATAGTGLQATTMSVDLRFGLETDDSSLVRPVLRTAVDSSGAPHSLRIDVSLTGSGS